MDLYYSDAYKEGLIPLLDDMISDSLSRINGDMSEFEVASRAIEAAFVNRIKVKIKAVATTCNKDRKLADRQQFLTKIAKDMALNFKSAFKPRP